MSESSSVIDQGAPHKYRTEIPNIVLELGLRPFALALYVHLKRTAGDGGVCEKSTRRMAAEMGGVSIGSVSAAKADLARPRDELDGEALIKVVPVDDGKGTRIARDVIVIADVWPSNMDRFGRSHTEQAVQIVNGAVHSMNGGRSHTERGRSHTERKEGTIGKEPLGRNQRKNQEGSGVGAAKRRRRATVAAADGAPRTPAPLGPGAAIYRDLAHLTPNNVQRTALDNALAQHGEEKFRSTLTTWMAKGFNPRNVYGMTDVLEHGWRDDPRSGRATTPAPAKEERRWLQN